MLMKPDSCKSCLGYSWGPSGYVPADGSGENGVLVILEAAGADEAAAGIPTVGAAGHYLWSSLARVGIERDGFRIHNCLSCQPPGNKLAKAPYEATVIESCSPLLDATIYDMQARCKASGKTFTILALGKIAFKRIMSYTDKSPVMHDDYNCYPHWNEKYGAWVIAAPHPSFLMRGSHHLLPVLQFAAKRSIEIASTPNFRLDEPNYLLDPDPSTFEQWTLDYLRYLAANHATTYLSYDIETPFKQGKDEEDVSKEEDEDYTILRCSFAYLPGQAVSVPWRAEYMSSLHQLFASSGAKVGWNNQSYDSPRIKAQLPINGEELDAMWAWHVLNTSMPKGLGFVTPFYNQKSGMWKHLSNAEPAYYNAKDADMALVNWLGIRLDLIKNNLWTVFDRHINQVNQVFSYMSSKGVLRDEVARNEAEAKVGGELARVESEIQAVIPMEAKELKVYKKTPKSTEGLVEVERLVEVKKCSICGLLNPKKAHFKPCSVKKLKLGLDNICEDAEPVKVHQLTKLWARPLEWKISKQSMLRYQAVYGHQPMVDWKTKKVTFDESAIERLMKKYPKDKLYSKIIDRRGLSKLLSTYIGATQENGLIKGGMPIGNDGYIHTQFTRNPSTLRSASQQPNLQNLPRPQGPDDLATLVRNLIIASPGNILTARDYSGIEAVLVGYFALSQRYIRLAKMDIHSYYTSYALNVLDGRVKANDLPLISWDDDKLARRLAEIKKEFKQDRNELYKHLVHGNNFAQGAKGSQEKIFQETRQQYPLDKIKRVMGVYFELFPEIKRWHSAILHQADKDGFLRNPFGYIHRFNRVYDYEKIGGVWQKEMGADGNRAIAFLPQSTAMGIIVEALLRLYYERFDEAGQYLRLLVHDELWGDVPIELVDMVDSVMKEEMEKPISVLRLPTSYGMGPYLSIETEGKRGPTWAGMH